MSLSYVEYTSLTDAELASLKTKDGKVHLFNNFVCPFGHRALWAAAETNVPTQVINIDLNDMPASYVANFNRYHTVPFLLDNGNAVYESAIVAQFLDAKYNAGAIHNRDFPEHAALAQLVQAKFEAGPFYGLLRNKDPSKKAELEQNLRSSLSELERIYREHASDYRSKGPYLLGDKFSSAELNIVTFLFRFKHILKHYRDFDILEGLPLLTAALEASEKRPAFKLTTKEPAFYINGYAKFAA
ncbi:hypothetical protein ACHHYP_04753 [Achlya hypogyna]|uniref:Glutathione transferase family protein n=1 Tax=Achlya hypogyna TaxID=1202772 RepID=A0A1V9YZY1_ACHHY|nr:hypothetical protein ACHHYP_04753 [Achlya hypogyna]